MRSIEEKEKPDHESYTLAEVKTLFFPNWDPDELSEKHTEFNLLNYIGELMIENQSITADS
jgi:predicted ATP-dependent Lon-type protease